MGVGELAQNNCFDNRLLKDFFLQQAIELPVPFYRSLMEGGGVKEIRQPLMGGLLKINLSVVAKTALYYNKRVNFY